ncbi:Uma2 family endonuclease [Clostridium tagluense]|uniref:Uma2 family endonuclease n=1 Tax=Clostridium tagluense TaxID=360422 RepID=UPI001CF4EB88|nr:Uma2 family endonuclease [Clostridium tagluense]MCB2318770.1 Uma2 family endonuclease [Clostridium tagluense]MCB2323620.1 Uma2 family endonuclease [Clostridium tagluense]MCB2333014.1 Uma2 family endonuclease [Clostridium tagluense]MCB2338237.1 Uma2 family endonuclease [Clostridium tagluense]
MENNLIKEEWINGNIMMSPRPQYNHVEINGELYSKLKTYFNGKCKVVIEGALFLTKDNPKDIKKDLNKLKELVSGKGAELVPDVAVYCDKEQIFKRGFLGVPQLVVEVLSPSNSEDDTIKKKDIYESFGVPEYWIASPMSKKVYVYNLEDNRYKLAGEYKFLEQDIKSSRFDDLVVDIKNIDLFEYNEDDDI